MIQVKSTDKGYELRNSQQKAALSGKLIEIGEMKVNEPGEYESDGIEIVYGENAALIVWDKLQIVYIFSTEKASAFEKSQFSPCDVVMFGNVITELTKGFFNETLETYDPNQIIISSKSDLKEIEPIIKTEPIESVKIASSLLPEEGREFITLT